MTTRDSLDLPSWRDSQSVLLSQVIVDFDSLRNMRSIHSPDFVNALMVEMINRFSHIEGVHDVSRVPNDSNVLLLALENAPTPVGDRTIQQVEKMVRRCYKAGGTRTYVTASIGISGPQQYNVLKVTRETLVRQARIASMNARDQGGNRSAYYTPDMDARLTRQAQLVQGLHTALQDDAFTLTFQPQFALIPSDTNVVPCCHNLIGAEALLRWETPELGAISPAEFIPIAESTGLAGEIDFHVIALFAKQVGRWRARGNNLHASINLSACSFTDETLALRLLDLLASQGVDPKGVTVEITETALMSMSHQTIANIECLRRAGIAISVDDFGSGYASLSYLKDLIVSEIKIDKSFIRDLSSPAPQRPEDRDRARVIVKTILELAQTLKIRALAEGVENLAQLAWLHGQGCRAIQGHFTGRAVALDEFEQTHADVPLPRARFSTV